MIGLAQADLFATKGIEYLLVLVFLFLLVPFWLLLTRSPAGRAVQRAATRAGELVAGWLRVPDGFQFHPGHAWARPEGEEIMRVGLDDFARRLVGPIEHLRLPEIGSQVEQGERGWRLEAEGKAVDMLSPVGGQVLAVNENAVRSPELVTRDPYGQGWLLKIRLPRSGAGTRNLLSGDLARAWMKAVTDGLTTRMGGEVGPVSQDGGVPVDGFARQLRPDGWDEVAAEYFLTG